MCKISAVNSPSCYKEFGTSTSSKWLAIALLVSTVVLFGGIAAFGGIRFFSSSNSLPQWLSFAIGPIGQRNCMILFVGGCLFGSIGGISGVVLLVKYFNRQSAVARDKDNETSLHKAACEWNLKKIKKLIRHGADINAKGDNDQTPLHKAAYDGNSNAISALLAAGADVNARDKQGRTPLHWTVMMNGIADTVQK